MSSHVVELMNKTPRSTHIALSRMLRHRDAGGGRESR
jgi:hypothetical protein